MGDGADGAGRVVSTRETGGSAAGGFTADGAGVTGRALSVRGAGATGRGAVGELGGLFGGRLGWL